MVQSQFEIGSEQFIVVSRSKKVVVPSCLSSAEVEVFLLLAQGKEKVEIALVRKTSERTVANQLGRLYEKLGVRGRGELLASLEWVASEEVREQQ